MYWRVDRRRALSKETAEPLGDIPSGFFVLCALEHFVAKWNHLASQKCDENKNLERFRVSVKNGNALVQGNRGIDPHACRLDGNQERRSRAFHARFSDACPGASVQRLVPLRAVVVCPIVKKKI